MKILLAMILSCFVPIAAAQTQLSQTQFTPAVIFDSPTNFVKALRPNMNIDDSAYIRTGTDDPTVVATLAPKGSLYLRTGVSGGQVYVKADEGTTTNWTQMGSGGSVSSVALSLPSIFSVTGSPITTSGTLTGTLVSQAANSIWAGPASGPNAPPTFRSLVAADLPSINLTSGVSGTLPVGSGGTGSTSLTENGILYGNGTSSVQATSAGSQYQVFQTGSGGIPTVGALNLSQSAATTGALPIAKGGTGATTQSGAANAILPSQTGQNGMVLGTNGTDVSWVANGSGGGATVALDNLVSTAVNADINPATNNATNLGNVGSGWAEVVSNLFTAQSGGILSFWEATDTWSASVQAPSGLAASYTLTLPLDDGSNGECLTTNGSGILDWSSCGSGGGATTELDNLTTTAINASLIPDTDATLDLGDSSFVWGTTWTNNVTSGTGADLVLTTGGSIFLSSANSVVVGDAVDLQMRGTGPIKFYDSDSSNSLSFQAPGTLAGDFTFILPVDDGTSGQFLQTNGTGTLSWQTVSASGANTALSNLVSTAVNDSIIPGSDGAIDLGSASLRWQSLFVNNITNSGGVNVTAEGGDVIFTIDDAASFSIQGEGGTAVPFRLYDGDDINYAGIQSPQTIATNYTLTLPPDDGDPDEVLVTNGSGVLTWESFDQFAQPFANGFVLRWRNVDDNGNVDALEVNTQNRTILGNTTYDTTIQGDDVGIISDNSLQLYGSNSVIQLNGNVGVSAVTVQYADQDTDKFIGLKAPEAVTNNTTFTLPDGDGVEGAGLLTDGAGQLYWNTIYQAVLTNIVTWASDFPAIVIDGTTTEAQAAFGAGIVFKGNNSISQMVIQSEDLATSDPTSGIYIYSGNNSGTGATGELYISTGAATDAGNSSNTGNIDILSGGTFPGTGNSGQLQIKTGTVGSGTSGNILFETGPSGGGGGTTGDVIFSTGSTAGTKGKIQFNANSAFGAGLTFSSTTLQSNNYILDPNVNYKVIFDGSGGPYTVDLPPCVNGISFVLVISNTSSGTWTLTPDGSDTLDTGVQALLDSKAPTPITCFNTKWYTL